jgi:hypothetical protein
MKNLIFFIILIFHTSLLEANFFSDLFKSLTNDNRQSEDVRIQEEREKSDDIIYEHKSIFSNDDEQIEEPLQTTAEKMIYLSYLNYPKRVYLRQHFVVSLKAILIDEEINRLKIEYIDGDEFVVINKNPKLKKIAEKSFVTDIYFKLLSKNSKLPAIKITAISKNNKSYSQIIKPKELKLIELKHSELFSGVMAKDLKIISHKEKRYDDKNILVLMDLNASMSNLEDFHLPFVQKEALDSFEDHLQYQKVYYVCIVPNYQKEFKFKYFNLNSNHFTKVSFPIVMADLTLSTQLGLNPKKSKLYLYELILLFGLASIFFIIFLKTKSKFSLFLSLIIAMFTLFTKVITPTVNLPKGTKIRILPTHNSTIFFKTSQPTEVKVMLKKEGYSKILLPGGKIGWIKDEDIQKN